MLFRLRLVGAACGSAGAGWLWTSRAGIWWRNRQRRHNDSRRMQGSTLISDGLAARTRAQVARGPVRQLRGQSPKWLRLR